MATLIGHWKMDGNALDSSSQGNNGTETAMTYVDGKIYDAGSFNGTTSKIVVGDKDVYDFPDTQSFSIAFWAKYDQDGSFRTVVSKFDSFGPRIEKQTNSILRFGCSNGFGQNFSASFVDNVSGTVYHFFVAIRDVSAGQARTYLDNVLKQTITNTLNGNTMANAASLVIGSTNTGTQFWNGQIDGLRIYTGVLTDAEMTALFLETSPPFTIGSLSIDDMPETLSIEEMPMTLDAVGG